MSRPFSDSRPLLVAIVGSGPSGFYAADALLKSDVPVRINMFERLPIPYGLVRSGVAPDHPKLKKAIKYYARIAAAEEYCFFGNVSIGQHLAIDELTATHHAVIIACGAESDRKLGIPGEDLQGSHTATEFVGWYNGHPDYRDHRFDLSCDTAVIIGQGNVAADVSRILAKTVDELKHTDIAAHALESLAASRIRDIHVIARRGPAQSKFSPAELKEFGGLEDCTPLVDPAELELNPASLAELEGHEGHNARKVVDLFRAFSQNTPGKTTRYVHFTFCKSPLEVLGPDRVTRVQLERNRLTGDANQQRPEGTAETLELDCGSLFRSIGYRGIPIPGLPFDDDRGLIPNRDGRVLDGADPIEQVYVTGWIKRGPTGLIGTNKPDSHATVDALLADRDRLQALGPSGDTAEVTSLLDSKGVRYITFADWEKIDQNEIQRGQPSGKPREKFTRIAEMLKLLDY